MEDTAQQSPDQEYRQRKLISHAVKFYRAGDESKWCSAAMCAQVAGSYQRGATLGLAAEMNKSVDTVESMAHAYDLYSDLKAYSARYVRNARKTPGIYLSHFTALYDIKKRYNLDIEQTFDLLDDIVQAAMTNDKISSRDLEKHAMSRYGLERPWDYYAMRTLKALSTTLQCPDLPDALRHKLTETYELLDIKTQM